jgi:hypothetical protein
LGLSLDEPIDILGTIDYSDSAMNVAQHIIDNDTHDWVEELDIHEGGMMDSDLLILSRIELLPKFRGLGIGKKAIKDLDNNFIQGCGLFALKCFPLQCEVENKEKRKDRIKTRMEYESFEGNEKKACKSLRKHYRSIGLSHFINTVVVCSSPILLYVSCVFNGSNQIIVQLRNIFPFTVACN